MLDDFGTDLENTESKIDTTMKKMAKVLHMNNGNDFNRNSTERILFNNFLPFI